MDAGRALTQMSCLPPCGGGRRAKRAGRGVARYQPPSRARHRASATQALPSPTRGEGTSDTSLVVELPGRLRMRPLARMCSLGAALLIAALIAVIAAPTAARADSYPSKTITIIAPASPGGV